MVRVHMGMIVSVHVHLRNCYHMNAIVSLMVNCRYVYALWVVTV